MYLKFKHFLNVYYFVTHINMQPNFLVIPIALTK